MLYLAYDGEENTFKLARNNPETGHAETKTLHPAEFKSLFSNDGAVNALLALAKEVPNQFHIVPNPQPKRRAVWGRIVQ